jgi:hypothetical protein
MSSKGRLECFLKPHRPGLCRLFLFLFVTSCQSSVITADSFHADCLRNATAPLLEAACSWFYERYKVCIRRVLLSWGGHNSINIGTAGGVGLQHLACWVATAVMRSCSSRYVRLQQVCEVAKAGMRGCSSRRGYLALVWIKRPTRLLQDLDRVATGS